MFCLVHIDFGYMHTSNVYMPFWLIYQIHVVLTLYICLSLVCFIFPLVLCLLCSSHILRCGTANLLHWPGVQSDGRDIRVVPRPAEAVWAGVGHRHAHSTDHQRHGESPSHIWRRILPNIWWQISANFSLIFDPLIIFMTPAVRRYVAAK